MPLIGDYHNQGLDGKATAVTATNGSFVANGKIGKCLKLGYTNNIIIPSLIGSKKMSWAYWCRIDEATATNWLDPIHWTSTKADGSDGYTSRQEFYTNCTNTGVWYKGGSLSKGSFGDIVIGEWNHFAFTIDYEAGEAIFYINGNQVSKGTTVDTTHQIAAIHNIRLGENGLSVSENDVRIYDEILSPKVIKEISKGLVCHYTLAGVGENILTNTKNFVCVSTNNGTTTDDYNGFIIRHLAPRTGTSYREVCAYNGFVKVVSGGSYTQSFWAKGSGYLTVHFYSGNIACATNTSSTGITNTSTDGNVRIYLTSEWKRYWVTHTLKTSSDTPTNKNILLRLWDENGENEVYVCGWKLEKGSVATPWTPNPADPEFTKMGFDDGIEYDVSGYGNNGTKTLADGSTGSFEYTAETPRYWTATHIHSLNPSTNAQAGTAYINANCSLTDPNQLSIAFWENAGIGYSGGQAQGMFCTTNNAIGSDYLGSAMNHRDNAVDINSSDGNDHLRLYITFLKNEWHHYAFTYDGQYARSYRDGILQDTKNFTSPTALGSFANVFIGFSKAGGVWRRNDAIYSDFRIYATALSADDILALYNTPISLSSNGTLLTQGEFTEV